MPDDMCHYQGPHWSAEPTFGQTAAAIHTGDVAAHIQGALRTGAVQDAVGHSALLGGQSDLRSDVRDAAHAANRDLAGGQRDILRETGDSSRDLLKEMCSVRADIHMDGGTTRDRISESMRFVSANLADVASSVSREGGESRLETVKTGNSLLHAVERQHSDAMQVLTRGFCDTQKDILQAKSGLELQAANIHSDLKQQVFDFKQSVEGKLAECCCRLEGLIRDENGQTRTLLQTQEGDRLRSELTEARATINQQGLLNAIVGIGGNGPGKS